MAFKDWFKRRTQQMEDSDTALIKKLFGRPFFHRYYEGYTEIREPCGNRRGYKIKRVYSANYYQQRLSKQKSILIRLLHCALLMLSAALLCYAAWIPAGCNYVWYSTLPQAASFAFIGLSFLAVCNYVSCGKNLKIRDYKQGTRALKRWSLFAAVSTALAASGAVLYGILTYEFAPSLIVCIICYLLSALAALAINRVESSVEYVIVSNPVKIENVPGFQIEEL